MPIARRRSAAIVAIAFAALVAPAASGPATASVAQNGELCCADDQNVSAGFSTEFVLLSASWGWPEGDPRELAACAVLGGQTVTSTGRVDTSAPNGFEVPLEPCSRGRGTYNTRREVRFLQIKFLCTSRYPCAGAQFVLSRAVRVTVSGLPPPVCHVPRVIGLRLLTARARIREAGCRTGLIRRVRSRRVGRVLRQSPAPGAVRSRHFPVRLVVGRR
jgi:hypothetical protein